MADPLPPVEERDRQFPPAGGSYREWIVLAAGYNWRVRAVCRSASLGIWSVSGVRVTADTPIPPAEAYRLAEYVTRAAAYCEAQERERKEQG